MKTQFWGKPLVLGTKMNTGQCRLLVLFHIAVLCKMSSLYYMASDMAQQVRAKPDPSFNL